MNHNFVDWEITKILPTKNPYNTQTFWNYYAGNYSLSHTKWNTYVRDAWTFEDIRIYLENKSYYLSRNFNKSNNNNIVVDVWRFEEWYEGFLDISFKAYTYEKARNEAIKHCLKLINKDES